jgi:hypothetical protein
MRVNRAILFTISLYLLENETAKTSVGFPTANTMKPTGARYKGLGLNPAKIRVIGRSPDL